MDAVVLANTAVSIGIDVHGPIPGEDLAHPFLRALLHVPSAGRSVLPEDPVDKDRLRAPQHAWRASLHARSDRHAGGW